MMKIRYEGLSIHARISAEYEAMFLRLPWSSNLMATAQALADVPDGTPLPGPGYRGAIAGGENV